MFYYEGDFPNKVFFINKGKVKSYKLHEDGKEYITKIYNDGEFFGFLAMLENEKYKESAQALEPCEICIISRNDFVKLISTNREVSNKFIQMLANNFTDMEKRLMNLAYSSVRKRVADMLIMLEEKYHSEEGTHSTVIPMLREDLASIVGTAKETVIRTLGEFKEEELVAVKGSNITILDLEGLKNLPW